MKSIKTMSFVAGFFVLVAVIAIFALPILAQDDSSGADPDRYPVDTITVTGTGSAAGTPDTATVEIGVETRNPDVSLAFDENNATVDAVISTLIEAGIAQEDIRTVSLGVYMERFPMGMGMPVPELYGEEGATEPEATYVVHNLVRVVVRDISLVGDVISAAVDAGANNVYGLNFGIEDQTELEREARIEAMADAEARAAELAQLAGAELGQILVISESWGGAGPFDLYNMAEMGMGGGGGAASIEPGQLSVMVQVQVTFRINR